MRLTTINCPFCCASDQSFILDSDLGGGWISCFACGGKMHVSGSFIEETPENIAKTIDELAVCIAPYYGGENH